MFLNQSRLWIDDLDATLVGSQEIRQLNNKTLLITGATGLIGSAIVDLILRYNDTCNGSISLILAGRNLQRMIRRFDPKENRTDISFLPYDATNSDINLTSSIDYIIHAAGNASPDKYMLEPVETMIGNFCGLYNLLQLARNQECIKVLYVSSSEVYGKKDDDMPYREDQYGYIDLLTARSSYPVGKRAAETLCVSFSEEYNVATVIVRPGHVYGPTASMADKRVSSLWSFDAAFGRDIIMKSDGKQIRSYCYCLDCASAILKVLISGVRCTAYNISDTHSVISIRRMAELLAKSGGVNLITDVPAVTEAIAFNPMENSSLDGSSLEKLGWKGLFNPEIGFPHTVGVIKEMLVANS